MHIAFAFNMREVGPTEDEPPSCSDTDLPDDLYAEWDDSETINAVAAALATEHQVSLVQADLDAFEKFRHLKPDLVFNMAEGLHGISREAQIPALLEMLNIPYTGSDPTTLGICLDKGRTKEILSWNRIPTPGFWIVSSLAELPEQLTYPLIVKPCLEGSSKGVTDKALVYDRQQLAAQVEWVNTTYQQSALVEEFLPGREFTVAMIGNGQDIQILPIVEIDFTSLPGGVNPIYSYEAKWIWDTEAKPLEIFTCPAKLEPLLQAQIEDICRRAFQALKCRDWCRIDVRLDAHGHPSVIELNPLPGILPRPEQNSCFPKAARAAGLSYEQLILKVVDTAAARLFNQDRGTDENCCLL
ncbi:D-alanine--D-alanine ligase family protein [Pelobacter seleniigenes]|uniref:D-alanine--D-alanine ligase family protein n=1 Tax=Pelobacter seleniigenes TaxID=407188 RepID=UPI0004A7291C|nr:ATP-grasp domain-containing protein [Pelobacter seleniigenes]